MNAELIRLANVSYEREGQTLLQALSFAIHPAEILSVIGPNGAGKSTLVELLVGLREPSDGEIRRPGRPRLGYMPQHLRFDATLPITVERFLSLAVARGRRAEKKARLRYFQRKLGIEPLQRSQVRNLSGGEMQRVLLARACLREPELMVLDEPTQGVDVRGQAELYRLIGELRDELGCAVLIVSHDLHLVMAQTDNVICLNRHICCYGTPQSVENHPEYRQLFGEQSAADIAVYTHHHDHEHDLHGNVVDAGEADSDSRGCRH